MDLLRKILFPFAVLYGGVTLIRNFLFDRQLLSSKSFGIPIIAVGNLSVGGTGKSPMIEYLVRLLSPQYKIATLSRGYKRRSEGYMLADASSDAAMLGDEPYQFHTKFPEIAVAVDADRAHGIEKLITDASPDVILLDDAFQHRKVAAGFYILLTAFGDLYADDFMLPTGNLRESRSGASRANVIVVTKCPPQLSLAAQEKIRRKLKAAAAQQVFFTSIGYDDQVYSTRGAIPVGTIKSESKVLLAGIARPGPFFEYLQAAGDITMVFPDHHIFTDSEIIDIQKQANNRKIITTEKDFVRLKDRLPETQLFYLPIQTVFLGHGDDFNQTIQDYVGKSTANS